MKKSALLILFFLLSSCAYHSAPVDNKEFRKVTQLSELEGVYKNKGNPSGYLSQIIWSDNKLVADGEINHEAIEFIDVIAKGNALTVKAIANGCSVYERTYTEGRDFNITDGKIILNKDAYLLSRGAGDVVVGPSYEQVTLGLDSNKSGKSKRSEYAAGLVLFIFPVAVSDTSEAEYERVGDKPMEVERCPGR